MPKALHKATQQAGAGGVTAVIRPTALRPVHPVEVRPQSDGPADVMIDPLHPMHQDLLARMSGPKVVDDRLPRPQRLAIVFYASIAAWALVWIAVELAVTLA